MGVHGHHVSIDRVHSTDVELSLDPGGGLDRMGLLQPTLTYRARSFGPDRIRGHHEHVSRTGCVFTTCHISLQLSPLFELCQRAIMGCQH